MRCARKTLDLGEVVLEQLLCEIICLSIRFEVAPRNASILRIFYRFYAHFPGAFGGGPTLRGGVKQNSYGHLGFFCF